MIQKQENCTYCGKKLESKTAKKRFCDDKCRIYFGRELNKLNPKKGVKVQDLNIQTNVVKPPELPKSNFTIDTTPKKEMPKGLGRIEQMRWIRENS